MLKFRNRHSSKFAKAMPCRRDFPVGTLAVSLFWSDANVKLKIAATGNKKAAIARRLVTDALGLANIVY